MRLAQNQIRKNFAPLNVTASILVLSPDSPLMQSFDAITNEVLPSRVGEPLSLLPKISMKANDGSLPVDSEGKVIGYDNSCLITDNNDYPLQWLVNGKPISEVFKSSEYVIILPGEDDATLGVNTRGLLKIYKDLTVNEEVQINFDGYVRDARTAQAIHVVTKSVHLGCSQSASDEYTLVIMSAKHFVYNPVNDHLLEYEYCKANNIATTASASVADDVSYLHTWNFRLQQGETVVDTDKYSIAVYDASDLSTPLVEDASDGIIEITKNVFKVDTRIYKNREFQIVVTRHRVSDDTDVEVARDTVSYATEYPDIHATPVVTTGYLPTDTYHANKLIISTMTRRKGTSDSPLATQLPYPDLLLDFFWQTVNSLGTKKVVGEGSEVVYALADAEIGENEVATSKDEATCNYGELCDGDWKPQLALAQDADGNYLSDGKNFLAFNTLDRPLTV